jgi:hypothetical protein
MLLKDRVVGRSRIFVGTECECTPHKGRRTLFVSRERDLPAFEDSLLVELASRHGCKHIYLGADFGVVNTYQAVRLRKAGYFVSTEFPSEVGPPQWEIDYLLREGVVVVLRLPSVSFPGNLVVKLTDSFDLSQVTEVVSATAKDLLEGGCMVSADFSEYGKDEEVWCEEDCLPSS